MRMYVRTCGGVCALPAIGAVQTVVGLLLCVCAGVSQQGAAVDGGVGAARVCTPERLLPWGEQTKDQLIHIIHQSILLC